LQQQQRPVATDQSRWCNQSVGPTAHGACR
jgi:hypothetical protein